LRGKVSPKGVTARGPLRSAVPGRGGISVPPVEMPGHQNNFWVMKRRGVKGITGRNFRQMLEAIAKPVFVVILNEVKDLKLLKMRDSSLRSE
jgi:hypothetical protein